MMSKRNDDYCGVAITGADSPERFFCKLFEDMIIRDICVLRRRELNNRDRFSCEGCSMHTLPLAVSRMNLNLCSLSE